MNLQVSVPYQKCVFKCPMCVARGHKNENSFANLYATDKREWQKKFEKVLTEGNYDSVVLTGECDPTQDMRYCDDVISVIRNMRGKTPTIEFTTHNQKFDNALISVPNGHKVDVVTLSVTNVREYLNAWRVPQQNAFFYPTYRMVILLTKEFEFLTPENFNTMGFDQITFKTLQYGEDGDVNRWIYENKMSDEHVEIIREIVEKFNSHSDCSVRLDTSCQTAEGRYHIFRSDGKVYDSWEAMNSMEDWREFKADLMQPEVEVATVYDKAGLPIKEIAFSHSNHIDDWSRYIGRDLDSMPGAPNLGEERLPLK